MTRTEKNVLVKSRNGKSNPGKVLIQIWSRKERVQKALKYFLLSWLAAFFSIFLPVAHFFLVTTFIMISPILSYFVYRQESAVIGGCSLCPYCEKPFQIAKGPNRWPIDDLCLNCQSHVDITLQSEPK